jgi:hypothetical protein
MINHKTVFGTRNPAFWVGAVSVSLVLFTDCHAFNKNLELSSFIYESLKKISGNTAEYHILIFLIFFVSLYIKKS